MYLYISRRDAVDNPPRTAGAESGREKLPTARDFPRSSPGPTAREEVFLENTPELGEGGGGDDGKGEVDGRRGWWGGDFRSRLKTNPIAAQLPMVVTCKVFVVPCRDTDRARSRGISASAFTFVPARADQLGASYADLSLFIFFFLASYPPGVDSRRIIEREISEREKLRSQSVRTVEKSKGRRLSRAGHLQIQSCYPARLTTNVNRFY